MPATVPALSDVQATLCIFLILMVPLAIGGLALMNTGFVRSRSAAHAMLSTLCAVAVAAIVYFAVRFCLRGICRPTDARDQHRRASRGIGSGPRGFSFVDWNSTFLPHRWPHCFSSLALDWQRRFRLAAQSIAGGLAPVLLLPRCWRGASIRCLRTGRGVADGWLSSAPTTRSAAAFSIAAGPVQFRPWAG